MRTLLSLALFATALTAQTLDYFPLQVGNQWVYKGTGVGASTRTIEVVRATTDAASGRTYFVVNGFSGTEALLRRTDENRLVKLDSTTGQESIVEDFAAATGASFNSSLDPCSKTGTIQSQTGPYKGPIGQFDSVLTVAYSGPCADGGILSDVFLPYVGLVQRTEQSIAGPRVYDLDYAIIGGVTQVSAPLLSFGVALDKQSYASGDPLTIRLTLRNTQPQPAILEFGSGQEYDIVITNESGAEVYRWSLGILFTQFVHTIPVNGEKNWVIPITPRSSLAPGKYMLQGYLTTSGTPARKYSASVGFEVAK